MKLHLLHAAAALLPFAISTIGAVLSLEARQCPATFYCGDPFEFTVPFYRLYSSTKTDHFYTTNTTEEEFYEFESYAYENVAGRIFATAQPGTVPFYRLYNSAITDHAYTPSAQQVTTYETVYYPPYADDGIAGWVYLDNSCSSTIPLYWAFSSTVGDSFYTTSEAEYNQVTSTEGYTAQGIAAWILPVGFTNP